MSVQAGILNFDDRAVDHGWLSKVSTSVEQYGPDGCKIHVDGRLGMLYRPFHTTPESRLENQPYKSRSGVVITWDGRLDNRDELLPEVGNALRDDATDVAIVLAAYEKWGTSCFPKLIGDWALSIWNSRDQELVLARDYIGVRHLYYCSEHRKVTWSTNLATLVLLSGTELTISDDYVAGFLNLWPPAHLTPYCEILAVAPGKFIRIREGEPSTHSYWSFEGKRHIHYNTDAEYEEHFRSLFRQSVRRRLRASSPILAELSGGLDSSSVVCMADDIIEKGEVHVPGLDTTSRFDPDEPGGDERPYFSKVELKRGRKGFHVDLSKSPRLLPLKFHTFVATPGSFGNSATESMDLSSSPTGNLSHRIVLSGIGGDEFLGGVPDPRPQLADLAVDFRWGELVKQLMAWSLVKRTPWIQLLFGSLQLLLPSAFAMRFKKDTRPESWVAACFARSYLLAVYEMHCSDVFRIRRPSQRDHSRTLAGVARQMACTPPSLFGCQEKRYPYLDRNLVEFLVSIPVDQLLRPGQRRSLMRRALGNLLPSEVLARRTKATTARAYIAIFDSQWAQFEDTFRSSLTSRFGYIDAPAFVESLRAAKNGKGPHLVRLLRGLCLELWLQDLVRRGVVRVPMLSDFSSETSLPRIDARSP